MNCTDARSLLPGLLYGDLSAGMAAPLREHVAHCPACRQHLAELDAQRRALDDVPTPDVQIDLAQLYRDAADRQARRLRRWRRTALALGAVAAVLLLIFGLRLEVRVEAHQVVL